MTQGPLQRAPIPPGQSGIRGGIAGAIGQGVAFLIIQNNPALAPLAALMGTATTGFLTGLGNLARNKAHETRGFGWGVLSLLG